MEIQVLAMRFFDEHSNFPILYRYFQNHFFWTIQVRLAKIQPSKRGTQKSLKKLEFFFLKVVKNSNMHSNN